MPLHKRELAFEAEGRSGTSGDWWHLVLDTETPGLYVEHTWRREGTHMEHEGSTGTERFGINDFLTMARDRPAHAILLTALSEIFRDPDGN